MSPFHIASASLFSLPFISPDVNFQPIGVNFQPEVAKVNKFLVLLGVFSVNWETKKGENKDLFYFRGFRGAAFILFCGGGGAHWLQGAGASVVLSWCVPSFCLAFCPFAAFAFLHQP